MPSLRISVRTPDQRLIATGTWELSGSISRITPAETVKDIETMLTQVASQHDGFDAVDGLRYSRNGRLLHDKFGVGYVNVSRNNYRMKYAVNVFQQLERIS